MAKQEKRVRWTKKALGEYEGYLINDPSNEFSDLSHEPVAVAVKSGSHLDDYPWDWYLTYHGVVHVPEVPRPGKRHHAGVTDTLRSAKRAVEETLALPGDDENAPAAPPLEKGVGMVKIGIV